MNPLNHASLEASKRLVEAGLCWRRTVHGYTILGMMTGSDIRIPAVCDDSSEEAYRRSLCGMIKNFIQVEKHHDTWKLVVILDEKWTEFKTATLTDALLSALCEQWGVEVS